MKTIIDSKQAEQLKNVCEEHKVKLPGYWQKKPHGRDCMGLTELLDWLPKRIDVLEHSCYFILEQWADKLTAVYCGYKSTSDESRFPSYPLTDEVIDSLFDLFIWTIENGFYKGVD